MSNTNSRHVRRIALLLATSVAALSAGSAHADAAAALDEVVVVGSRRAEQTALGSVAPVDVFTAERLAATGQTDLNGVLQSIAPSFSFPRVSGNDATAAYRPAALRGLSPDQTLVLVNGKRWHRTAQVNIKPTNGRGSNPVDLNTIPLSAIKRIEVLRDGASAQYGSDAIAGVINIVLNDAPEGGFASVTYGKRDAGDGLTGDFSGTAGFTLPNDGFLRLSGQYLLRDRTNRAGPDTRAQYFPGDPREATIDRYTHRLGDPKLRQLNLFANSEAPITDNLTFYAFGNFQDQTVGSQGNYRRANDNNNLRAFYPDGFLPGLDILGQDYSVQGGLRHSSSIFGDVDLSASYARNTIDFDVFNSVNATLGTASPTQFDAGGLRNEEGGVNLDTVREFAIGGLASPLTFAAGAGYRWEKYTVRAGEPNSYRNGGVPVLDGPNAGQATTPGSQGFPGFQPSDAGSLDRHAWSAYTSLEADLTSRLQGSLAFRYEDYSDFGSKATGKISGRYEFADWLAVRATASTGFRAPTLGQQRYATTETTFVTVGTPPVRLAADIKQLPVGAPAAIALGATPLKAETSVNYSAGLVLTPGGGFDLSVDYYRIDIDDRIVLSENLIGPAVQAILTANGFGGAAGARYFTNGVDTSTQGVDVVGNYRRNWGDAGTTQLQAAFNWGETEVQAVRRGTVGGLTLVGRQAIGLIEKGLPETKVVLSADHTWNSFTTSLKGVRYGKYSYTDNANPTLDQEFGAQWVVDLDVAYKVNDHLTLAVGANNLFDSYPDEFDNPTVSTNGLFPYSSLAPDGFSGAFYYVRARANF